MGCYEVRYITEHDVNRPGRGTIESVTVTEKMSLSPKDYRLVWFLGILALICANLPYIAGLFSGPQGATFTGLIYNIDDSSVYLTWIRQAAEGNFFLHNRFTTEPQQGLVFNLFFLLLGTLSRISHLSAAVIYAVARPICGGLLLWAVWRLILTTLADRRARILAFSLVCFAAGFGFGSDFDPTQAYEQPIDRWQPEAITFLSLYFTPLFTAALALMVVFVTSFLQADRSGKIRDLWPAMLAGFLLGNFHSYDILQLFGLAAGYWIVTLFASPTSRGPGGFIRLALVGLAMLPTAGYQFWALQHEAVFHARAFDTSTLSPSIRWVLLGFGLPLLLTIVAALVPSARAKLRGSDALRLLLIWGIVAIAISYAPHVSFQRKLLMGAHLPLCLLAGAGLAAITEWLTGGLPAIAAVAAVLIAMPSNLRFIMVDMVRLSQNRGSTHYRPYLLADEKNALDWLDKNVKPGEGVLVSPDPASHLRSQWALMPYLGVFIPAYTSGTVYCAHWSETARFGDKLSETKKFFDSQTTDEERQNFLSTNSTIRYIVYANDLKTGLTDQNGQLVYQAVDWTQTENIPVFLRAVYHNDSITVLRVETSLQTK